VRAPSAGYGGARQRAGDGNDRQYVAGELSVLLAHVQAVTTTEAAMAFTRQAAVCAKLHEFGVCAGLPEA
jgi:hypothetical protein